MLLLWRFFMAGRWSWSRVWLEWLLTPFLLQGWVVPGNEEALSAAAQRLGLLSSLLAFPSAVTLCQAQGKADHFLKIPHVHLEKVLHLKSITIHSFSQQKSLEFSSRSRHLPAFWWSENK